jgi:mannose-6-phosphate isomerase-like protein (cupin superfamily)
MSLLIAPEDGLELRAFGEVMTVKLGGSDTGGSPAVVSAMTPPRVGPPPHIHHNEDELFIVVEGSIAYFSDDTWTTMDPDGVVYPPRDRVHACRIDVTDSICYCPKGSEQLRSRSIWLP